MYRLRKIRLVLIMITFLPGFCFAQKSNSFLPHFEVNRIYPYLTVSKNQLNSAATLMDLNPRFQPSWIRDYISVEIRSSQNGQPKKSSGNSAVLSLAQKELMQGADAGSEISIKIKYIPENTLKRNDPKEIDFSFIVQPEKDALFDGGEPGLRNYLIEKAIQQIPEGLFTGLALAAVKFSIDESGEVVEVSLFESSKDHLTDQLLLKAIAEMPCWQPAKYATGLTVKQEFALTVGNMDNCMVNLLGIHRAF